MKKFIFIIIALVTCLIAVGTLWNQDVRKEQGCGKYQDELAKKTAKINELEDSIRNMQAKIDFYDEAVNWLRGVDDEELEIASLAEIWKCGDSFVILQTNQIIAVMGEDTIPFFENEIKDTMQGIIKVVGVGGGGCNAVRNMYNEGVAGVSFAACNTDSQSLKGSPVPVKLLMGEGLGAGGDPEIGKSEAEKSLDSLKKILSDGTKMVFITASMGGGTGTGSAPVVAQVAKELNLLTVGVVTIPFYFEKKQKIVKALKGVDELRKYVDAILIINNERLCDVYSDSDISLKEAFSRADNILKDAVKGISELITVHSEGSINLDFRDVEATMKDGGGAIMAMGRASGDHRVEKAILDALNSPLLYGNDIGKAKRILFNIYASEEHPIFVREMQEIDDFFDQLDPNISVIWGTSTDDSLGEDAKVTILATGLEDDMRKEVKANVHRTDDDFYEDLIPMLYKPAKKPTPAKVLVQELPFEVTPAPEPEPAVEEPVVEEPKVEETPEPEPQKEPMMMPESPTVSRWKSWLNNIVKETREPVAGRG